MFYLWIHLKNEVQNKTQKEKEKPILSKTETDLPLFAI